MSSDQESLRRLLLRPDHPVIGILDGTYRKVTARQAVLMLRSGSYEWCGSRHRVRKMRSIDPVPTWQACYRTTKAATLPPSIEWCLSRRY